jgi:hypothetical protein
MLAALQHTGLYKTWTYFLSHIAGLRNMFDKTKSFKEITAPCEPTWNYNLVPSEKLGVVLPNVTKIEEII